MPRQMDRTRMTVFHTYNMNADLVSPRPSPRPNHVVAFLRPKENQSPTTATFKVPLTFNKLDFRDYLYHVYGVEVNSVRSFINQMRPKQRNLPGKSNGKWYRPRSQKLMLVDLKKPFVWPERPKPEDRESWDHNLFTAVEKGHDSAVAEASEKRSKNVPKLRTPDEDRDRLRSLAEELLSGKRKWVPGADWTGQGLTQSAALEAAKDGGKEGEVEEEVWTETETDVKVVSPEVAQDKRS